MTNGWQWSEVEVLKFLKEKLNQKDEVVSKEWNEKINSIEKQLKSQKEKVVKLIASGLVVLSSGILFTDKSTDQSSFHQTSGCDK